MTRIPSSVRVTLVAARLVVVFLFVAVSLALSSLPVSAQLFGGSNNAPVQGDDTDQRLDRLENSLRQLTGAIEQLQYRNQQLEQQVRSLGGGAAAAGPPAQAPVAAAPPAGSRTAPQPAAPPAAPGRRSDVFDPEANPSAPGAPRVLGSNATLQTEGSVGAPGGREAGAPLDLNAGGALPAPPPRNASATGAVASAQPGNPSQQLGQAYSELQGKDYAAAEATLRDFVKRYPKDKLADEANFWLGETLYQRQQYSDAAQVFLDMTRNFGQSSKAPDAYLRLGQSLAAINAKEAACAAYTKGAREYPNAPAGVKRGLDAEQKKSRC